MPPLPYSPLPEISSASSPALPSPPLLPSPSVLQGLNQDSADVHLALSDKLGQLIKSLSTFFAGRFWM